MMKKFLIGLLAVVCALTSSMALTACGDETEKNQSSSQQTSSEEEVSSSGADTSSKEDSSVGAGASEEENSSKEDSSSKEEEEDFTKGLEFKKIDGKEEYMVVGIGEATETDIVIPSKYEGLPVTTIGNSAFYYSFTLTSVEIPDSIISIQSHAFTYCEKLQFNEYENCKYLGNADNPYMALVEVADKSGDSYKIHESTKIIADSVFANLDNLMTVVIPDSVQTIGAATFYGSTKLENLTIGKGVVSIDEQAFALCYGLKKVVIPDGVVSLGEKVFYGCEMTEIVIPDSVTSIGERAFQDCKELTGIYITDLTAWCNIEFGDFGNPFPYAKNLYLNNKLVTELVIPETVKEIKSIAFNACQSLTSVIISDNVTVIGDSAFLSCFHLESVTIGKGVTSIGKWAFYDCNSLKNITFEGTVEEWNALEKGDSWNDYVPAEKVICSNGEVEI